MAYRICPKCKKKVSAQLTRCMHCNYAFKKEPSKKAIRKRARRRLMKKILIALFTCLLVLGALFAVWKLVLSDTVPPSEESVNTDYSIPDECRSVLTICADVQLGMTKEEVIQLQTEAGLEMVYEELPQETEEETEIWIEEGQPEESENADAGAEEYVTFKGTIASVEGSSVRCRFEDGILTAVWYRFSGEHGSAGVYNPEEFSRIGESLAHQFGEQSPLYPGLFTDAVQEDIGKFGDYLSLGVYKEHNFDGMNHWLIKIGPAQYAAIDHFLMSGVLKYGGGLTAGYHSLCYQLFTDEEVEKAMQNSPWENPEDGSQFEWILSKVNLP